MHTKYLNYSDAKHFCILKKIRKCGLHNSTRLQPFPHSIVSEAVRYLKSAKQISAREDRQQKRPNMCYRIAGYTAMLDSPSGGRE